MTAPPPKRAQGLLGWLAVQLVSALWLLVQMLLVGAIVAMARRTFSFKALFAGTATMLLGIGGLATLLYFDPVDLATRRHEVLWAGALVVCTLGGFVIGRVGKRIGFWESELAVALTAALFIVHLAKGWHVILGFGGSDVLTTWELLGSTPPGVRYLGPMWDRVVALVAVAGFLLSVFGGSLAFLFFSEGRFDPSFRMEWFISRRHLGREGRGVVAITALVAIIGIAVGVGALVAVTAVMSGYQEDIREKILTTNAHLTIQKYGIDFTEYEEVKRKALAVDGVLAGSAFVFNEAMLSDGERGLGVLIKGVVPETAPEVTGVEDNLCAPKPDGTCLRLAREDRAGRLARLLSPEGGAPAVIVGAELYKRIKQPIGSTVLLTTPVGIAGARGNAPKRMEFRLVGVVRSGMHEFDARLAYTDLRAAQQLLGMGDAVNGVELRVRDPEQVDVLSQKVMRAIGRYPYRSLDWRELNSVIFTALNLQKVVMFLVLTFIVIVAAFNIASTLFMAVVERAREIAVLKSMGARDASVMKIFIMQGWVVGGIGTALGVVLGLAICAVLAESAIGIAADVYMVESLKVRVWPLEIGLVVVATMIIAHLATIYPALKAARQRPVDAMRYA